MAPIDAEKDVTNNVTVMVYIYLKLTEVREIVEMSNFSVACHQAAAGDVREGGGDVGKRGQAVHPWRNHLENSLGQFWMWDSDFCYFINFGEKSLRNSLSTTVHNDTVVN